MNETQSKRNFLKAHLEQIENSHLFTDAEKKELTSKLKKQLDHLENVYQKRDDR